MGLLRGAAKLGRLFVWSTGLDRTARTIGGVIQDIRHLNFGASLGSRDKKGEEPDLRVDPDDPACRIGARFEKLFRSPWFQFLWNLAVSLLMLYLTGFLMYWGMVAEISVLGHMTLILLMFSSVVTGLNHAYLSFVCWRDIAGGSARGGGDA